LSPLHIIHVSCSLSWSLVERQLEKPKLKTIFFSHWRGRSIAFGSKVEHGLESGAIERRTSSMSEIFSTSHKNQFLGRGPDARNVCLLRHAPQWCEGQDVSRLDKKNIIATDWLASLLYINISSLPSSSTDWTLQHLRARGKVTRAAARRSLHRSPPQRKSSEGFLSSSLRVLSLATCR
jgi:hypothetical protein